MTIRIGKTTVARELVTAIQSRGRSAIHLSTDDFHHRRAHRYRQGRESPCGYNEDAYDFDAFVGLVLAPLGPDGDSRYGRAVLDPDSDERSDETPIAAEPDAICWWTAACCNVPN
jgi:uridine kinase